MTDHDAFLRTICEYPFDLRPRLVFADFLDENDDGRNGFAERAEFIRWHVENNGVASTDWTPEMYATLDRIGGQCQPGEVRPNFWDWAGDPARHAEGHVWLNGFVEEVRCPLDWWVGGECGRCAGTGIYTDNEMRCVTCHGTGRTPANGPAVVSRHPVTRVVAEDTGGEVLLWDRSNDGEKEEWVLAGRYYGQPCPHDVWLEFSDPEKGWPYPTREAAEIALSRALVDWARERAGLPAIKWEVSQ